MKLYKILFFSILICILASCHRSNFASFQSNRSEIIPFENKDEFASKTKVKTEKIKIVEKLDFPDSTFANPLEIATGSKKSESKIRIENQIKKKDRILIHLDSSKFLTKIAKVDSLSNEAKLLKRAKTSKAIGIISIVLMLITLITFSSPVAFFFLVFGVLASFLSFLFGIGPLIKLPKGKKKMAAVGVLASALFLLFLLGVTVILLGVSVGS